MSSQPHTSHANGSDTPPIRNRKQPNCAGMVSPSPDSRWQIRFSVEPTEQTKKKRKAPSATDPAKELEDKSDVSVSISKKKSGSSQATARRKKKKIAKGSEEADSNVEFVSKKPLKRQKKDNPDSDLGRLRAYYNDPIYKRGDVRFIV
ncbi:uncharacterized protein MELLADRAFT_108182 [Melampsora larici-populina 98AG31]|uniref:Uncharacterized protein n=1 Tax=Melampsora larici-populina (strain 98AG31 / pathotype 3-4-7) TaxID=747676 RepID=F4RS91_MELLP|nr:uncharacterized protein MELLADRAFT_108182 [Melampsora larici-populina 98AG31]EGG04818.1 hypothetical protein MELLADRAFT_108182 [Melampsora larici-populina 98AG31]